MNSNSRTYFDNLDGLRFMAAMLVISAHYVTVFAPVDPSIGTWQRIILSLDGAGGEAGVSFFFVLSGFLITYLLLIDPRSATLVSVFRFYMRRVLRIWPLYYLSLLIAFMVYPYLIGDYGHHLTANWVMYTLFLGNFSQIYFGNENPLVGVHWTIAVEEQFYLVWPWIILLFRRSFLIFGVILCCLSIAFQSATGLYTHTISCALDLVAGALAAYVAVNRPDIIHRLFRVLKRWQVLAIYVIGFLIIMAQFQLRLQLSWYGHSYRLIQAFVFVFLILDQSFNGNSPLPASRAPLLAYFGKISYGLYLLHPIAIELVRNLLFGRILSVLVLPAILTISIVMSMVSYQYFERPFLKLKTYYN